MKLTNRVTLAALALGFAFGANAEPKNHWVQVEGGSWVPSTKTTSKINEQIESFVRTQAEIEGRRFREWKSYTFQYQGQEENGKKLVFINAFCTRDKQWQLNKQMVFVFDGGTCFFNLKYDPEKNQFFGLLINGEA